MIEHEVDVLVVGGGCTGICAAVAAARHGARVALIEAVGCLGGMGTSGLVPAFAPFNYNDKQGEPYIRGLAWEIVERFDTAGAIFGVQQWWKLFDKEKAKLVYDRMVLEAGVRLRFFTFFHTVEMDGPFIRRAITVSKAGMEAWKARVYIDASGDADVAAAAGVPFDYGDDHGDTMPPTLCFSLGGVDRERIPHPRAVNEAMARGKAEGRLRNPEDHRGEKDIFGPEAMIFNYNHIYGINGLKPDDLSRAMIEGREIAFELLDYIRETVDGFENAFMASMGILPGMRETRRIKGDFCLTGDAYFRSDRHEDDVCVYDYACDLHQARHSKADRERFEKLYYEQRTQPGEYYGIPYRSLLPVGVENLIVGGRCVSCDRVMLSSLRVMPPAMAMGQAAGTAAALALDTDGRTRCVSIPGLRKNLLADGAYIP